MMLIQTMTGTTLISAATLLLVCFVYALRALEGVTRINEGFVEEPIRVSED